MQHVEHAHHVPTDEATELHDHVVIGGYGRVGQTIARLLDGRERAVRRARHQRRAGDRVPQSAGTCAISAMPAGPSFCSASAPRVPAPSSSRSMRRARPSAWWRRRAKQRPDALRLCARASIAAHAVRLLKLGAVGVIPEAVEASLQLGGRLLRGPRSFRRGRGAPARGDARAGTRRSSRARTAGRARAGIVASGCCRRMASTTASRRAYACAAVTSPCAGRRNRRRRARCGRRRPCRTGRHGRRPRY